MTYDLSAGHVAQKSVLAPDGPYDRRLGYASIPAFTKRLQGYDFIITKQAQSSDSMLKFSRWGLFPTYHEKTQSGLKLFDRTGYPLSSSSYPKRTFTSFSEIPSVIVDLLLFIENRNLLDASRAFLNPAVDWGRLAKALIDKAIQLVDPKHPVPGGSTLATQLEKFRHSEAGITPSVKEKIRQTVSASMRSYLDGKRTMPARRQIILDYVNSIPLAAFPSYGEVHGLGDGLWVWYGAELDRIVEILKSRKPAKNMDLLKQKATALKQVLSLFIAQRRPSYYLFGGRDLLGEKCNAYLRLLAKRGIISRRLKTYAIKTSLSFRQVPPPQAPPGDLERESSEPIRTRLLALTGLDRLYALDRLDCSVRTTLDLPTQHRVTRELLKLKDPKWLSEKGLIGPRLLGKGDPGAVIFSFTLYEKTPEGNALRVHTDNYTQPLNINEGIKLDLGSSAKLRTLIHYLQLVADLYDAYSVVETSELLQSEIEDRDRIRQWAVSYLLNTPNSTLEEMLRAAIERRYSASPNEKFFTGGGIHSFENFDKDDNSRTMSVREGFVNSVNLVFVRLMRDVVFFHTCRNPNFKLVKAPDQDQLKRKEYLARFANLEGSKFLGRFYQKYRGKSPADAFQLLLQSVQPTLERLSALYRYVYPENDLIAFRSFLSSRLHGSDLSEATVQKLYSKYAHGTFTLADFGYVLRTHPLELWVVAYLQKHPELSMEEILKESDSVCGEVYQWLFKTSRKAAQNRRIQTLLEMEAFVDIHAAWKRLGYPFDYLVPSYATALGSSADRPGALAELMGIILNDGIGRPGYRIEEIMFAEGTPYETYLERKAPSGTRLLRSEVAGVINECLFDVVKRGTARRVARAFLTSDSNDISVGGKTGTGDHRYKIYGSRGKLISSKIINRNATFVFVIGDRFFGVITAFVPGPGASMNEYNFTSSLPLAVFKLLSPSLMPLLKPSTEQVKEKEKVISHPPSPRVQ